MRRVSSETSDENRNGLLLKRPGPGGPFILPRGLGAFVGGWSAGRLLVDCSTERPPVSEPVESMIFRFVSGASDDCWGGEDFKGQVTKGVDMGVLSRLSYVVRSKINAALNRAEDPSETLDYSYEQMRDELQEVKQGIADLTTQKKRLEMQKRRLEENVEKHNEQARQAVNQDREDLARRALEKKKQKMNQIEDLESQIASLQSTQDDLVEKKDQLQNRIEEFRTKKESMKARYEAAEAQTRVSEAMTGAGDEMEDVGRAIERAEERTEDMEARSEAMDELQESGVFDDALSDKDSLDRELEEVRTSGEVDAELETLKTEMGKGSGSSKSESSDEDVDLEAELETETETEATDDDIETELEELKDDDES